MDGPLLLLPLLRLNTQLSAGGAEAEALELARAPQGGGVAAVLAVVW